MVDYHIMLLLISLFVVSRRGRALATYIILLGKKGNFRRANVAFFSWLLLRKAL